MLRWIVLAVLVVLSVAGLGAAFAPTSTARLTLTPSFAASIIPARAELADSAARAAAAANAAAEPPRRADSGVAGPPHAAARSNITGPSGTTGLSRATEQLGATGRSGTAGRSGAVRPSGAGQPAAAPLAAESPSTVAARAAQRAIDAITDRTVPATAQLAAFPADFRATMGYTPTIATLADGQPIVVNPAGGCSVVGGGAPFDLAVPCKAHDLGYDLLRYSHRHGVDLPAEARRAVDDRLGIDLDLECAARYQGVDARSCDLMAGSFDAGVGFNSWRQEFEAPVARSGMIRTLGVGLLGLLVVGASGGVAVRRNPFRLPRLRSGRRRVAPAVT